MEPVFTTSILFLWLTSAILLYLTAIIIPGFQITSFPRAMIAAIIIGLLNALLKPLLFFLTLPFTLITFGLFVFVVNAIILRLAAGLLKGFDIKNWGSAIVAAITMTLLQLAVDFLFK